MNVVNAWKLVPKGMEKKESRRHTDNHNIAGDFSKAFSHALKKVNASQNEAERLEKAFVSGEVENVHEVMIASEKAKLALEFTIEIRNKLLEAYKTIERMPV